LIQKIFANPEVIAKKQKLQQELAQGERPPYACADELLQFITRMNVKY